MGFIASFVIALAFAVVGELLRPKQNPPNAKAAALDDFDIPTAEEGRAIPVIAGKVKVTGANVTWYGDLELVPIKKKVKTGWFSSATQIINWKYYLGMQMFLCHGRPEGVTLHKALFGDAEPTNIKTSEGSGVTRVDFNDNGFYGGDETEGGVSGVMRFYAGLAAQPKNTYWEGKIGETAPAYGNCCYAMLEHMYVGTSQYIKTVAFELSSYPNGLAVPSGHHIIGDDANPACFIYEILTNQIWGAGIPASDIDVTAFRAVAETLYTEGYGVSVIYNGGTTAKDLIADLLRHVDGCTFSDPETGLITIRLARADYDIEDLPVFGEDQFKTGISFSRPSWSETKNSFKVLYTDRAGNYEVSGIPFKNLANVWQRDGEVDHEDIDFTAFTTQLAARLAGNRAMQTLSYPLAKISGTVLRRYGWNLKPADVIRVNLPTLGIEDVVFRVVKVKYGTLYEPAVAIDLVEDIFAVTEQAYTTLPNGSWVNPIGPAVAALRQQLVELPMEFTGNEGATVATLITRGNGIDEGYDIHAGRVSGDANTTFVTKEDNFTPSGVTTMAYPNSTADRDATGFTIGPVAGGAEVPATVTEDELLGGDSVALIVSGAGMEFVAFKNYTGSAVTDVIRGIYGTTKLSHPSGAVVFFVTYGFGIANLQPFPAPYPFNYYVKALPYNVRGTLAKASASQMTISVVGRARNPYPARYLRVDGSTTPTSVTGSATLTWEHINPRRSGGRITVPGAGSDAVDPDISFTVKTYINNVLVRTAPGLKDLTYDYTVAMRLNDSSNTGHSVKFGVITSRLGATDSAEVQTPNFTMTDAATAITITTGGGGSTSVGATYNVTLAATGGAGAPYDWALTTGSLPPGLTIDNANQRIVGTIPAGSAGTYNYTIRARSPSTIQGTLAQSIVVS